MSIADDTCSDLEVAQRRLAELQHHCLGPDSRLGETLMAQAMAVLSHECRNALQRSQSCLSMLALEVRGQPAALKLIDRMQKAQDDLRRLFDDLRDYATPIRLDPQCCDLRMVWRTAWADLEASHKSRVVTLREQVESDDVWCVAEASRLAQVFRNVLDNALTACTDPVEILIGCVSAELDERPALCVMIRDNGPGLTQEQKQRMFEGFYTTKARGMGLGMAIALRIIQAHGGSIEARERAGRGTEIVITLPRGKP